MTEICEFSMLICFGMSWPISVYKSWTSRSTNGKSLIFMIAIFLGYISGILGKVIGGNINFVLVMYCFNLLIVSCDLLLYFRNRRLESQRCNG